MLVTIKEAKKLWCPMARMAGSNGSNVDISDNPMSFCISNKCMMWVWNAEEHIDEQGSVPKGFCGIIN